MALDPIYTKIGTTYTKTQISDVARPAIIEIGDSQKPSLFYPQVKTLHWNNECNISMRLQDADYASGVLTEKGTMLEWARADRIVRFYPQLTTDEDGGFEFEVQLNQKPVTNVLTFTLQTKGFKFFYQPPLNQGVPLPDWVTVTTTEALDAKGVRLAYRPLNVVGSWAAYHATNTDNRAGGKAYRAGKAFHLYRPTAKDSLGVSVWCDVNIDTKAGLLTITIPQPFLDRAVYPVVVDPTLGYTTAGASTVSDASDRGKCGLTPAASAGTTTNISVYGRSTSGTCKYCMVIYDNNTTTGTRLDYSAEGGRSGAAAWITDASVASFTLVAGTKYYVGHYHHASTAPGSMETNYDTGAVGDGLSYNTAYSSPPPASAAVESNTSNLYSAYITYTAPSGAIQAKLAESPPRLAGPGGLSS